MKIFLLLGLTLALSSCAGFKFTGRVCYDTPQGKVCAESDGQTVAVEANFSGK